MRVRIARRAGRTLLRQAGRAGAVAAVLVAAMAAPATASPGPDEPGPGQATGNGLLATVCKVHQAAPDVETTIVVPEPVVDRLLSTTLSYRGPCAEYGASEPLGGGTLTAFTQRTLGKPEVIGLLATDSTFDGLPHHPASSRLWCYDKDEDGTIGEMKCAGGHERRLPLSSAFTSKVDSPFTYVLANWNPMGHIPPGVWDTPHFDVHFYLNDNSERVAIRPGPCPQLTNCDDYELGKNLPAQMYRHPDFADLDAVEPAMGNHLLDTTTPELNGGEFTHTFIYGSWDGEITFYEPMVNLTEFEQLRSGEQADECVPIKAPRAWQRAGWYPTSYCLRHRDNRNETLTTLEDFVHRPAS